MLRTIDVSTSGLIAQRHRLNTIAENIANVNTTRDAEGNPAPFQRRFVTFSADTSEPKSTAGGAGVTFQVNVDSSSPPRMEYHPNHPDADDNGMVAFPNVNMVTEFVNALEASRAYQANVAALEITKEMAQTSLRILV